MNIYVENNFCYHYEIIESILTLFLKKIGINEDHTIYLKTCFNESFENYILKKFSNVIFVKQRPALSFAHKIFCTFYSKNMRYHSDKKNLWFICHDITPSVLEKENIYFLTPLCNVSRWFLPTALPPIEKRKSPIPTFIVQGKIEEKRRNYASLVPILEVYKEKEFQIKILGIGTIPTYLRPYETKLKILINLNFQEYHIAFSDIDCLLPLIDETYEHNYFRNKLSSSISYAVAYSLPVLCHTKLIEIYDLKNAYGYKDQNEFLEQFGKFLDRYE
jgi:hypothetical protein